MLCVVTPTLASPASVLLASQETEILLARPRRSDSCARATLTVPTMLSVSEDSVCAGLASLLLAPSVWIWTSVAPPLASVGTTRSASTPWAPSPAPAFPPSWVLHHQSPAQSHARESSVHNTRSAKLRTKKLSVNVSQAGPMTRATLLLDVWMSTSVVTPTLVVTTVSAPTSRAVIFVSASPGSLVILRCAALILTSASQSPPVGLVAPVRICPDHTSAGAELELSLTQ